MYSPRLSNAGASVQLDVVRNVPWAYTFTIKEAGAVVNISGRTYAAQIRTAGDALAATATCTITDAANGKFSVSFSAASTAALTAGANYVWSLEQTASGVTTELVRGEVTVYGEITQ
jgi:hypothetical protein